MGLYLKVPFDLSVKPSIVELPDDHDSSSGFLQSCYDNLQCSCIDVQRCCSQIDDILGFSGFIILDDEGKLRSDFMRYANPRATVLFCGTTSKPFDIIVGDVLLGLFIPDSEYIDPLSLEQCSIALNFFDDLHFASVK